MSIHWIADLDQARTAAADSGRLLFMEVSEEDCGARARLQERVYPAEAVAAFLNDNFVPVRVAIHEPEAQAWGAVWSPTLILKAGESEYHRQVGYLGVQDLLAVLFLGQAKAAMGRQDFDAAVRWLKDAHDRCRDAAHHDAVLYWLGVASLKATGRDLALQRAWQRLTTTYPASPWTRAASYLFQ